MPLQDCQHTVTIIYSFTNSSSQHTLWLVKISDFFEAHSWFKMFTLTHNLVPQKALTFKAQTPDRSYAITRTAETCWCSQAEVIWLLLNILQWGKTVLSPGTAPHQNSKHCLSFFQTSYKEHPTENCNSLKNRCCTGGTLRKLTVCPLLAQTWNVSFFENGSSQTKDSFVFEVDTLFLCRRTVWVLSAHRKVSRMNGASLLHWLIAFPTVDEYRLFQASSTYFRT
jgi:hypothetical protein